MGWRAGPPAAGSGQLTGDLAMSKLSHTRDKIYKTVARQLHGVVPCWVCGEHVLADAATLEHIQPLSEGGNSHASNLAISHELCNNQRHAAGRVTPSVASPGRVQPSTVDKSLKQHAAALSETAAS